jgi:Flp pilus assembly protein CpaB
MAQQNNSRIRQQKRQRMIIIMTLLILVAIAAFFILSPKPKQVEQERQRPPGMIAIPVAKQDIKMGSRISSLMFRISYLKPSEVPTDALISPKEFVGRFARRTILASEHFKEADITEAGAHSGFSGIAKPGMRIVHISANLFPGSLNTMRIGDRIDLLSIESSAGQASSGANGANIRALEKQASDAWGGQNPGDGQAKANARAALKTATVGSTVGSTNAVTATLIAENAEVMYVPRNMPQNKRSNDEPFVVLQMTPEDAHVSVLAATIGSPMRVVFRPFSDDSRLTPVKEVKVTTRLPKPSKDPDSIIVINGLQRKQQRPFSETYRPDSENSQRFSPNDDNLLLKGNNQQQRNLEPPDLNLYGEY